uniref:Uncharacterized protein n=1 Tax=Sphaerodactylus townsendi TaxID=933632 RepID=A0ACB8ERT3_9SAUR
MLNLRQELPSGPVKYVIVDNLEVNRRMAPGKHVFMKAGEDQRAYIDSFGSHVLRKPVGQNPSRDCTSHGPSLVGTTGPAKKAEKTMTFLSATDVQEGTKVPGREKLSLPYLGLYQKPSVFSDRHINSATDSVGYHSMCQSGEVFALEKGGVTSSSDLENEGGEYCSIVDCCRESLVHQTLGSPETQPAWPESENHIRKQDGAVNTETKSKAANFGEEESKASDPSSDFQRDKHLHDSIYNHLHSETEILAFPVDTVVKNSSPVGLGQGNYLCSLDGASDQTEDKNTENVNAAAGQPLACQVGIAPNEPIYAESTKRKKVQLGNSSTHLISNVSAYSPTKDQTDGHWRERAHHLNPEREFQDSATQVAATITIMAAHTENDNRTIFLSSPDSAVGVQWPCVSPTFHPETGKMSSSFEHIEGPQESSEMILRENDPALQVQMTSKNMVGEGPAIPPKLSKGSPPRNEGSVAQSPGAGTCDSSDHEDVNVAKNGVDPTTVGPSCSLHVNSISSEDPNRGLSSSCSERRHKYYNLSWSRQCRIEEEEEEQGLSKNAEEMEAENGVDDHQEWRKCSALENKTGGMSKSASFAFEFPKDKNGIDNFAPPPPPPKKQFRYRN